MLNQNFKSRKKIFRAKKNPNRDVRTLSATEWDYGRFGYHATRLGVSVNLTTRTIYVWRQEREWNISYELDRKWAATSKVDIAPLSKAACRRIRYAIESQHSTFTRCCPLYQKLETTFSPSIAEDIYQFHNILVNNYFDDKYKDLSAPEAYERISKRNGAIWPNMKKPKTLIFISFKRHNGQVYEVLHDEKGRRSLINTSWKADYHLKVFNFNNAIRNGIRHAMMLLFGCEDTDLLTKIRPGFYDERSAGFFQSKTPLFLREFINIPDPYAAMGKYFGTVSPSAFNSVQTLFSYNNPVLLNLLFEPYVCRRYISSSEMDDALCFIVNNLEKFSKTRISNGKDALYRQCRAAVKQMSKDQILRNLHSTSDFIYVKNMRDQ